MKENRFWSTQAKLEIVTRAESDGNLLRLDAGSPMLVLDPALNETHVGRVLTALAAWLKLKQFEKAGKRITSI